MATAETKERHDLPPAANGARQQAEPATAETDDWADVPIYMTYKDVGGVAQATRRHIGNLIRLHGFPKPVYFGPGCPRFKRSEVRAWMNSR